MAQLRKKSILPYYLAALCWILAGLMAPMYDIKAIALAAAVSLGVFFLGRRFIPDTVVELPDPPATTGDEELDALAAQKNGAMAQMRTLNTAIDNKTITMQITRLETLTGRIIDHVVAHPEKKSQIRRFMDYYLPTTLKILGVYSQVDDLTGENVGATKKKVENMMGNIVSAFEVQLDALFQDISVDIAADIQVMEQLIAQEGLDKKSNDQGGTAMSF